MIFYNLILNFVFSFFTMYLQKAMGLIFGFGSTLMPFAFTDSLILALNPLNLKSTPVVC